MFYKVKQAMSSRADDLCRGDWPVVLEVKGMSSATWILKTISNLSVGFVCYSVANKKQIHGVKSGVLCIRDIGVNWYTPTTHGIHKLRF